MNNPKLQLKNFRVFGDEGAEFEMAPITILTGCNSSGKSSVIKSMMLLQDFLKQIMTDCEKGNNVHLEKYELSFMNAKHNLGTFDNAINMFSKSKTITIACQKYSLFLGHDIDIYFKFVKNEDNVLNSGRLKSLKISFNGFRIFEFDGLNKTYYFNLVTTKSFFLDFMKEVKEHNREKRLEEEFKKQCYEQNEKPYQDMSLGTSSDDEMHEGFEKLNKFLFENKLSKDDFANYTSFKSLDAASSVFLDADRIFDRELKHNSLFNLPLLDWLENVEKKNISDLIFSLCKENNIDEYSQAEIFKIIDNFKDSKFNYFIDYYRYYEDLFLEAICIDNLTYRLDFQSDSFFSNILDGAKELKSILDLRRTLLIVNPRWQPFQGADGEIDWETFGHEDFNDVTMRFKVIYKTMLGFSCLVNDEFRESVGIKKDKFDLGSARAKDFEVLLFFYSQFLYDSILKLPSFVNNNSFIGSERINVQRLYTKDQNTDFTNTLFELAKVSDYGKNHIDGDHKYKAKTFLKKWLRKFEIADDVIFEPAAEGLGLFVYLTTGKEKRLLADVGFGVSKLLAMLFKIELHLINTQIVNEDRQNSGKPESSEWAEICTIVIEEPESNLHPKLQSLLADMLVELMHPSDIWESIRKKKDGEKRFASYKGFKFIIETHSEYLIRKLQTLVARKEIEPSDVSIEYIYHPNPTNRPAGKAQVEKINIKDDGRLDKPFGSGFFDEADNLAMDLLTIKSIN
jgi:hypothetical protein